MRWCMWPTSCWRRASPGDVAGDAAGDDFTPPVSPGHKSFLLVSINTTATISSSSVCIAASYTPGSPSREDAM